MMKGRSGEVLWDDTIRHERIEKPEDSNCFIERKLFSSDVAITFGEQKCAKCDARSCRPESDFAQLCSHPTCIVVWS
jgi:hypothetical protein